MFNFRIINAPGQEIMAMLSRRMNVELRKELDNKRFDCVAFIQADLPSLFYFADIAQKAGSVLVFELNGSCPQHISTLALLGDIGSVNAAVNAINNVRNVSKK